MVDCAATTCTSPSFNSSYTPISCARLFYLLFQSQHRDWTHSSWKILFRWTSLPWPAPFHRRVTECVVPAWAACPAVRWSCWLCVAPTIVVGRMKTTRSLPLRLVVVVSLLLFVFFSFEILLLASLLPLRPSSLFACLHWYAEIISCTRLSAIGASISSVTFCSGAYWLCLL